MPREPVLRNTYHGPRTSLPQRSCHSTDHVQQNISPNRPTRHRLRGERGGRGTTRSRTTTRASNELSPPKSACAGDAVLRTSTRGTVHMGQCAPEDSISQCPFLQMIDTAHATARPATATPLPRPTHTTTGWRQDRRPVVSKRPLHRLAAAKMSPHIHIGPEPVLAAHARSLPAAGSRCPAGADSAPHSEQNFSNKEEECVFITAVPITEAGCVLLHTKLFARGFPLCVFITAVPNTKLFARGGGGPMQSNNVVPSSQRMRSNQLILSNIFDGAIYI